MKLLCVLDPDISIFNSDIWKKRIMQYPVSFKLRSIAEFHTSTSSLKQDRDTHRTSVEQEANVKDRLGDQRGGE
jgi:hypothetical protein